MPRKRTTDPEPAVSADTAAGPAKAPAKRKTAETKKARVPRASANAVTHHHKKSPNPEAVSPAVGFSVPTSSGAAAAPARQPVVHVMAEPAAVPAPAPVPAAPASEDIARLAYSLWEARGYQGGSPEEDWFTAERMLRTERTAK